MNVRNRPATDGHNSGVGFVLGLSDVKSTQEVESISKPINRALVILANFVLVAYAAITTIRLVRSVSAVVVGLQRDGRIYAISLLAFVVEVITLAALILLLRRRPLGWFLALAVSVFKFVSICGLHAFRALVLGRDSLPRGWLLGVLLWLAISLLVAHPRVRRACRVETRIWVQFVGAAAIAVTLTVLMFWAPGWDLRASG